MKNLVVFGLLAFFVAGCSSVTTNNLDEAPVTLEAQAQSKIYPDQEWKDTKGNRINAHSGSVNYENGFYYWYGVNKIPGTDERSGRTAAGVQVYRSTDLINWDDFGITLSTRDNPNNEIYKARMERPKIVYNEATDKYVMYFKLYKGKRKEGTDVAYTGVATADKPLGPFAYSHKFRATSDKGSGDPAFFQYPNGDLYHIVVRRSGRMMVMAKMRDDYLYPATSYTELEGVRKNTEGTTIFRRNGTFHLIGSGSGGWDPNTARYFTSKSLKGPWTEQANPLKGFNPISKLGPDKSFGGQSSFINEVRGKDNAYILMMDVHRPRNPYDSRYIQLPFKVENGKVVVRWQDSWNLGWFGGGGGTSNTSFEIRAKGKSGGEKVNFRIDQQTISTFTLSKGYKTYKTSSNLSGGINVEFFNDAGSSSDVQIDYIKVGGQTRQAEAQSYNTGAWGNGKCGGGSYSEMMQCNGVLGFGQVR